MGKLEYEYRDTLFVPVVRDVDTMTIHPGYRYNFFKTFRELDNYFSRTIGSHWQNEEWARYWLNQHKQTQNEDRLEEKLGRGEHVNGFDFESVREIIIYDYILNDRVFRSKRKLAADLRSKGHNIAHHSVWKIINHLKNNPALLSELVQNVLGEKLPENECRYACVKRFFYIFNLYFKSEKNESLRNQLRSAKQSLLRWISRNESRLNISYILKKEKELQKL